MGFPASVIAAMENHRSDGLWLSPSSAASCPRRRILSRSDDYYEPLDWSWAPGVGTAIHEWIARASTSDRIEQSLETTIYVPVEATGTIVPVTLRGTPDDYHDGLLTDYKTVSDFVRYNPQTKKREHRTFPEPSHELQVNLYRLLLERNGYPVERARIFYIKTTKDATRKNVLVPLWDLEDVYLTAVELATPLATYHETGVLPDPYPEDDPRCRWCPVREHCRRLERGET